MSSATKSNWLAFYLSIIKAYPSSKSLRAMGINAPEDGPIKEVERCRRPPTYEHVKTISPSEIENIKRMYWKEKLSQREIGKKYNVCACTISNFMVEHNIKSRSKSSAAHTRYAKQRTYIGV